MEPTPDSANGSAIVRAATADGHILPVIDVTHHAFRVADDADAVHALRSAYGKVKRLQYIAPGVLSRGVMWLAARYSSFARALLESDTAYLDGLHTYILKLGGHNLPPPFNGMFNRRVADSPVAMSMRVRLQQLARMMAEELAGALRERPGAPLHFVNIGGGVGIDSLNALILLQRMAPELLSERRAVIHVLDADAAAPAFGAAALAALRGRDGPLAELDATLEHMPYNWHDRRPLATLMRGIAATQIETGRGAVVAASSEGGVFEYGGDDAVTGNLLALGMTGEVVNGAARREDLDRADIAGGGAFVLMAGSVTRADQLARHAIRNTRFELVPRGIEGLEPLAEAAGYSLRQVEPSLLSDQFVLRKRDTAGSHGREP